MDERASGTLGVGATTIVATLILAACSVPVGETRPGQPVADSHARVPVNSAVGVAAAALSDGRKGRVAETAKEAFLDEQRHVCPRGMVDIEARYCIDRYEASLVELLPTGEERTFSPFEGVEGRQVRAVSSPNVYPQGYISAVHAQRACSAAGKRLCHVDEWRQACLGPEKKPFGYGEEREPGRCNDNGKNPVVRLFGWRYTSSTLNQPSLNQLDGTLARTGSHEGCTNGYGVYDMVGNLHEWVADPNGTFSGGYYQDVQSLGHGRGCSYVTRAHTAEYHDYSTGFRCCADVPGVTRSEADELGELPTEKPAPRVKAARPTTTKKKSRRR